MGLGTYVWPVNVTVPNYTDIIDPLVTLPEIGWVYIDSIELRIPVGHRGLTGIYIADSGTQLVPYSQTPSFIQGDDERLNFDVGQEVDTGLQIVTYNTDVFPHTFYLRISGVPVALSTAQPLNQTETVVPVS